MSSNLGTGIGAVVGMIRGIGNAALETASKISTASDQIRDSIANVGGMDGGGKGDSGSSSTGGRASSGNQSTSGMGGTKPNEALISALDALKRKGKT